MILHSRISSGICLAAGVQRHSTPFHCHIPRGMPSSSESSPGSACATWPCVASSAPRLWASLAILRSLRRAAQSVWPCCWPGVWEGGTTRSPCGLCHELVCSTNVCCPCIIFALCGASVLSHIRYSVCILRLSRGDSSPSTPLLAFSAFAFSTAFAFAAILATFASTFSALVAFATLITFVALVPLARTAVGVGVLLP